MKNPSLQALLVDELDGPPAFAWLHQGAVIPTYWCYALHHAAFSGSIMGFMRLFLLRVECSAACTASVVHLVRHVLKTDPALWASVVKHMITAFVLSLLNIIIPLSLLVY